MGIRAKEGVIEEVGGAGSRLVMGIRTIEGVIEEVRGGRGEAGRGHQNHRGRGKGAGAGWRCMGGDMSGGSGAYTTPFTWSTCRSTCPTASSLTHPSSSPPLPPPLLPAHPPPAAAGGDHRRDRPVCRQPADGTGQRCTHGGLPAPTPAPGGALVETLEPKIKPYDLE